MNTHTSLKLSQWLEEKGFMEESKLWIVQSRYDVKKDWHVEYVNPMFGYKTIAGQFGQKGKKGIHWNAYPAYDLLWDLCVKYGKEIFGEHYQYRFGGEKCNHTEHVFNLLQQNKTEDAEQYIMKHSIL